MKKYFLFLFLLLAVLGEAKAQTFSEYQMKTFNWGAKVGFNSAFPLFDHFTIDGKQVEDINTEYKVGLLASLFCRINLERFFVQPSLEWTHSKSDIYFNYASDSNDLSANDVVQPEEYRKLKVSSFGVPVLIGYNIIKEGPYGLSLMAGPKIKYNYKNSYFTEVNGTEHEYTQDSTPWNVGIIAGVGVSISRLFFDFTYEFGLNATDADFHERASSQPIPQEIRIDKRTNMMSFSLGVLF